MGIISLEQIEFFAYHGVSDEERKIGNRYTIDISVEVDFSPAATEDSIKHTLNYELLYKLVKTEMEKPTKLLENLAYRIVDQVLENFTTVQWCEIRVAKSNPPIGGNCKQAVVKLKKFQGEVIDF